MGTFHHLRHSTAADASRSLTGTDADSHHSFAITIFIWTASAWVLIILFFVLCICQCYSSRNGSEGEDDSTHAGDDEEEDEATSETASTTGAKIDFVEKLKPTTLTVTPKHLFLRRNSSYRRPLNRKMNKNKRISSTAFRCSGNGAPPQGLDCICENTETTSTCREEDDDRGTYHEVDLELQQQQQDPVVQNAQDDEEEEPMPFDEAAIAAAESSEIIMVEKEKVTMLRIPVVTKQTRKNKNNKKNNSSQEEEAEEVTHLFVPNTCAICLGSFRPKQQVSWSSSADKGGGCSHAFHTSCIVEYAHAVMMDSTSEPASSSSSSSAAEQQPKNKNTAVLDCPMCRGPFLTIERREEEHHEPSSWSPHQGRQQQQA